MTTIYLIRHAEAEGNLYRIAQGQDDSILTDRGWRQVKALERRFEGVQIDEVYASDLYRTRATASAICLPRNLTPHLTRDLREIHVGVWERKTWGEFVRRWPEEMERFGRQMDRWRMEGAETPAQVLERALEAVRKIAAENDGKSVAVFSHGYVIRLLLANLQGISLRDTGAKSPTGDNTAVSLLEWDGAALRVVWQNDNSHLQTPEYLAGEKVRRRANGLEPGLYFAPPQLPAQGPRLEELIADSWEEAPPALDPARPALVGYLGEEPVGLIQFGPAAGEIALLCVRRDCRRRGFGVQLIGQAVYRWRPLGAERLRAALPEGCAAERFFRDCGFAPAGEAGAGKTLWEKDIGFDPAFKS